MSDLIKGLLDIVARETMVEALALQRGIALERTYIPILTQAIQALERCAAPPASLAAQQKRVGAWALRAFGPTPEAVHAARMGREMADVHDCVAIGDMSTLGRALAGVLVVAFAIADSQNIDLAASFEAEQSENEASQWRETSWGQWERAGDGTVPEGPLVHVILHGLTAHILTPQDALTLLKDQGASQSAVIAFLSAEVAGIDPSMFTPGSPCDLPPAALSAEMEAARERRRWRRRVTAFRESRAAVTTGNAAKISGPLGGFGGVV